MSLLQIFPLHHSLYFLPEGMWGPPPAGSFHLWTCIWWCRCTEKTAARIIDQFKRGWIHRWTIPYECAFFKQTKNKLNNCYIRANQNKNTEDSEYGTGMQEEEKRICYVLKNKWQIIGFRVLPSSTQMYLNKRRKLR